MVGQPPQSGEVHWSEDTCRQDEAPEADDAERQGQAARHRGGKVGGRRDHAEKAVKNALEQELLEEMFGTILEA